MKVIIKTEVQGNYLEVINAFDMDLFEALKPKNANMEIIEFTGSKKGDHVKLRFNRPIGFDWVSEIIEDGSNADKAWFIDVGTTLPYPLKKWHHKHIVEKITDNRSYVIDEMTFEGPNKLITTILRPFIYLAFRPRKKVYKRYFAKESKKTPS